MHQRQKEIQGTNLLLFVFFSRKESDFSKSDRRFLTFIVHASQLMHSPVGHASH
jgi:hypothetical protein